MSLKTMHRKGPYTALVILLDLMHLVQTLALLTLPFSTILTVWIFAFHFLLLCLLEWLTWLPETCPFPQTSHFLDISLHLPLHSVYVKPYLTALNKKHYNIYDFTCKTKNEKSGKFLSLQVEAANEPFTFAKNEYGENVCYNIKMSS